MLRRTIRLFDQLAVRRGVNVVRGTAAEFAGLWQCRPLKKAGSDDSRVLKHGNHRQSRHS